jgi:hypothetical protein
MTGAEDLEQFIHRQENAVRKYRRLFKLAELVLSSFLIYFILLLINMDQIFSLIRPLELLADKIYTIGFISVAFSSIALFVLCILLACVLVFLLHIKDKSISTICLIEENNPDLKEKLRTAYDNRNNNNIIVNDLINSVNKVKKEIPKSSIIVVGGSIVTISILLIATASFGVVTYSNYRTDITPEGMKEVIDNIPGIPGNDNTPEDYFPSDGEGDEAGKENITGEPVVVVVEGEEVDLSIPPGSESGFTPTGQEDENQPKFKPSSSYEVGQMTAPAYREEFPEGYEPIIKSYFEELTR